jgi:PAS domain S-box-containing protein
MSKVKRKNTFVWYLVFTYIGLILVVGSQYYSYRSIKNLNKRSLAFYASLSLTNQITNLRYYTKEAQANVWGYIITGNKNYLEQNELLFVELEKVKTSLNHLETNDLTLKSKVKEALLVSDKIVRYNHDVLDLYHQNPPNKAVEAINSSETHQLQSQFLGLINEIVYDEKQAMVESNLTISSKYNTLVFYRMITSISGFVIATIAIFFLVRDKRKSSAIQKKFDETQAKMLQYFEAIPDAIIVINEEKDIMMMNQSGRTLLGIAKDEIVNLSELEEKRIILLDPENAYQRYTHETLPLARGLVGNRLNAAKIDYIKDNQLFNLESNVMPILDLDGHVTGAISVLRDITERVNYEATLENAKVLAEISVQAKDVFLSNISHELRTPLNAIIGFTDLLGAEEQSVKSDEYTQYIKMAGENLLGLINDLLDFSKIEAGQIRLEYTSVELMDVINSVSIIVNQRAEAKEILYVCKPSADLPAYVKTDKLRLIQILLNICGNAVKFTEKGKVEFTIDPLGPEYNGIQMIRFEIKDSGIGIPEDQLENIFNRFEQATDSTTRIFGGTGLGLSIVKSLVGIFGGTLTLKSELGKGSVFTIDIPIEILTDLVQPIEVKIEPDYFRHFDHLRVLAAEDNILNQKLLSSIFSKNGVQLTIVDNGQEALNKLKVEHFDLVLMDLQMPIMDGYETVSVIRREISADIPIIIMSAHALVGEKEKSMRIGANSFLTKPFKEIDLFRIIEEFASDSKSPEPKELVVQNPVVIQSEEINLDYLNEITSGDDALRNEIISLFITDYPIQLQLIQESIVNQDVLELNRIIHKFRSSLFTVGLMKTAERYQEFEIRLINEGITEEIQECLYKIEKDILMAVAELDKIVSSEA